MRPCDCDQLGAWPESRTPARLHALPPSPSPALFPTPSVEGNNLQGYLGFERVQLRVKAVRSSIPDPHIAFFQRPFLIFFLGARWVPCHPSLCTHFSAVDFNCSSQLSTAEPALSHRAVPSLCRYSTGSLRSRVALHWPNAQNSEAVTLDLLVNPLYTGSHLASTSVKSSKTPGFYFPE